MKRADQITDVKHHSNPACESTRTSCAESKTAPSTSGLPTVTTGQSSHGATNQGGGSAIEAEAHFARVGRLFAQLRSMYRHKATDFHVERDGRRTYEFRLWIEKTAGLTDAQFAQGVKLLEQQEAAARRTGDESWPPSYAGFVGLATMSTRPRSTVEALPHRADPEVAREQMARIREMLH